MSTENDSTVRDSGNVNGIRDLTSSYETGLGKRAILGRAMTEFRDAGSGPPFRDPISKYHSRSHA